MEEILEKTSSIVEIVKPRVWTLNSILVCLSNLTFCMVFHSLNAMEITGFAGHVEKLYN